MEALFWVALAYALFAAVFAFSRNSVARAFIMLPLTLFFIFLVKTAWELLAAPIALVATAAAAAVYVADVALMFAQLDED